MPRTSLPWLILATVLISAALAWWTLTRGGVEPRPSRLQDEALAPFHAIEVGGNAAITLLQSDAESIDVEAPGRVARVDADVSAGRLVIRAQDRRRWWSGLLGHRRSGRPNIVIRFRQLDDLALTGNVKLDAPKLATTSLRIVASGGSSLSIGDLRATSLRVNGSGALQARLAGRVESEDVSISGAGSYSAEHLYATHASVSVSGVGNVVLQAERTLHASISGAGVIEYVGDPDVTERVSGIGRVKRRESRAATGTRAEKSGVRDDFPRAVATLNARFAGKVVSDPYFSPLSLKNSGAPVTGSISACTPGMLRTSDTWQSRISASSIAATSCTASYG
jgi:hypothetical protein